MVDRLAVGNFSGYTVDAVSSGADLDGAGFFTASANPDANGQAISITTDSVTTGGIIQTAFGSNGLLANDISATYIFRTNATQFTAGTYTVSDGLSFNGAGFQPFGPAVTPGCPSRRPKV